MMSKPTALILHDQPHVVRTLDYLVRTTGGLSTLSMDDIGQACGQVMRHPVALVMLDACRMGPDSAAQACARLRQAWAGEGTGSRDQRRPMGQIWFITSRASSLDLEAARELGADRILTMPFDPDLVQHLIWELGRQWNGPLAKAS